MLPNERASLPTYAYLGRRDTSGAAITPPRDRTALRNPSLCYPKSLLGPAGNRETQERESQRHGKSITLSDLPRTFQDAASVARRLGIRYLWIDLLCINQDSAEDWALESSSMRLIYRNCILNIAAAAAEDGSMGCFFDRDPNIVRPCRIRIAESGFYDFAVSNVWSSNILNVSLNPRAWVLQEQLLAPRVLHFSKMQLFWECNKLVSCRHCFVLPVSHYM